MGELFIKLLGQVKSVTFPSGQQEVYTYDAVGNLSSKTDRNGHTINYTYDNLYRLTRKAYPDSTAVNYTYDALNRLTQAVDPTGTYSFNYDNLGRLTGTTTIYASLTRPLTLLDNFSYDVDSDRTSMIDPEGRTTNFVYDTLDRLTNLTDVNGAFGFSYDGLSRRTLLTRSNGVNTNYAYDTLSRLLSASHQLFGATLDGASYVPDNVGNRTSKTDLRTQVATSYGYDVIYQLLRATQGGNATESYTYDAVGNRLTSLTVPSWVYNSSNELTSTTVPGPVITTYHYDANGNLTSKSGGGGGASYTWDFENRLTSATVNGVTTSFKYDPFGRRIKKISASGTTFYAYDGDNLIEEINGMGAEVAHYTQGPGIDEPLAELRSGATSFYEADGLGSVTSLTNGAGAIAQTYTFDSFGNQAASSGSVTNPFRFTAREFDTETGLYYYRARYYDPTVGRFLSEDVARFASNVNFYSYVGNDPQGFTDPSGKVIVMAPSFPPGGAAAVILGVARAQQIAPRCDCWFVKHGGRSLSALLNDPNVYICFDSKQTRTEGGTDLAYVVEGDVHNVHMLPASTGSTVDDVAQSILHELEHINRGSPRGSEPDARMAEIQCGFRLRTEAQSIIVTPK